MREGFWPIYRIVERNCPFLANAIQRMHYRRLSSVRRQIVGDGNHISWGRSALSSVCFDINGHENNIVIEDKCFLNQVTFFVRGNRHRIHIGAGTRFNRGGNVWMEDHDGSVAIGKRTVFEDIHIGVTEPYSTVRIGDDCLFAYDIDIRTGDSHAIFDRDTGKRLNPAADVIIGNQVWVGAHSILLKGVSIADGSVIGAGSVVTKSIEEQGVVAAGNPAKVIRRDIVWCSDRNPASVRDRRGAAPTDRRPTDAQSTSV